MKRILTLLALVAFFAAGRAFAAAPKHNTLTPAEKSAGWKMLFDGKTLDGWKALSLIHI